eukprot:15430953-Alexandrium_andersonii.AAC.1
MRRWPGLPITDYSRTWEDLYQARSRWAETSIDTGGLAYGSPCCYKEAGSWNPPLSYAWSQ